jgi:uncharacterized repeat protein (TIGR03803 family)
MTNGYSRIFFGAVLAIALVLATNAFSSEKILHTFGNPNDGINPDALVADAAGNLYGTTFYGGNVGSNCSTSGCGVIYKLTPTANGPWKETIIYRFTGGADGSNMGGLAIDAAGNLYGTTESGGRPAKGTQACVAYGCGTLFRLSPNASGGWRFNVLHAFSGVNDGNYPTSSPTIDTAGNVFVSASPGIINDGVIFEMVAGARGRTIHSFSGTFDGAEPGGVTVDAAGNLYGVTFAGGANGLGTVFKLTPGSGGQWTESLLYFFSTGDGGYSPANNLAFDSSGNLYGTTSTGGAYQGGVVYQLTPGSGGQWTETVLHAFAGGSDGASPAGITLDAAGNLFGTARTGGDATCDCGAVYELTPSSAGWTETTLYAFTGQADGGYVEGNPLLDPAGNLYGTTAGGGKVTNLYPVACGVVYELPGVGSAALK